MSNPINQAPKKEKTVTSTSGSQVEELASIRGELTYEDKVIQKIIGLALEKIDGLLAVDGGFFSNIAEKIINTDKASSGVNVEVGKEQVAVDLNIVAEYRKNIPELYQEIKSVVVTEVRKMTDLDVIEVNVTVVDIKTRQQHEADSVSLQDRASEVVESTTKFASEQFGNAKEAVETGVEAVQEKFSNQENAGQSQHQARVH